MKIACLHTADSNIAVFNQAAALLDIPEGVLQHHVHADLLAAVMQAGGLTEEITAETAAVLSLLQQQAQAVLLTCSSLGPALDGMASQSETPLFRVDRALAQETARRGGDIVVLCTASSTLTPTRELFMEYVTLADTRLQVRLVEGAWSQLQAGDMDGYLQTVANAVTDIYQQEDATVALAQASMAPVTRYFPTSRQPLTSPTAGLEAVWEYLQRACANHTSSFKKGCSR